MHSFLEFMREADIYYGKGTKTYRRNYSKRAIKKRTRETPHPTTTSNAPAPTPVFVARKPSGPRLGPEKPPDPTTQEQFRMDATKVWRGLQQLASEYFNDAEWQRVPFSALSSEQRAVVDITISRLHTMFIPDEMSEIGMAFFLTGEPRHRPLNARGDTRGKSESAWASMDAMVLVFPTKPFTVVLVPTISRPQEFTNYTGPNALMRILQQVHNAFERVSGYESNL